MHSGNVTTPFGRRPMTLALVKSQLRTSQVPEGKSADKWKVYRDVCDARSMLGLRDRALAVLSALLTFYPDAQMQNDRNLIVFPSNAQLTTRANGIAGTTLRENLAILVNAGLIQRCDSPNGKRYARKAADGGIEAAYGFSLSPLLARSEELAELAQEVAAAQRHLKIVKERITIARRDVRKLITAAIEDNVPGDWARVEALYVGAIAGLKICKTIESFEGACEELEMLREEVINMMEIQVNLPKADGNGDEIRQHIHNSNTESTNELEPSSRNELGEMPSKAIIRSTEPLKAFPIGMVLRACPEISMYGRGGSIENWRDLMGAAVVVRSMLGVSPSAYQEACEVMGPENAAATMAAILERAGHISSAGGYLRDLTARTRRGEFSLGPMLMALLRSRGEEKRRA